MAQELTEKEQKMVYLSGLAFAAGVVDKAGRVFSDVAVTSVPKKIRPNHIRIMDLLKEHRTNLIKEINNSF